MSEDPTNADELAVWMFPLKYVLNAQQLTSLNYSLLHSKTGTGAEDYLSPRGGYAEYVDTQIVLQNARSYPIRIVAMNVIKSCRAPLTGTLFYAPGQAIESNAGMGFDLDSADISAKVTKGIVMETPSSPDYFSEYTISLKPGAQQVFNIRADTKNHACTFRYQATVLAGDRKVYQMIGNGKQPFRISAIPFSEPSRTPFSEYDVIYAGGLNDMGRKGAFVRVNPRTYNAGDQSPPIYNP